MNLRWERTALRKWSLVAVAAATVASLASVVASQRPKTFDGRPKPPVQAANSDEIQLCQALGPAAPYPVWGVDSTVGAGRGEVTWDARGPVDWQAYAQGEYVGHARLAHVPEYRIRVDDRIIFVFRLTREMTSFPYELQVGDKIRVESLSGDSAAGGIGGTQDDVRRELVVQPDGTITLPLLGQVRAASRRTGSWAWREARTARPSPATQTAAVPARRLPAGGPERRLAAVRRPLVPLRAGDQSRS